MSLGPDQSPWPVFPGELAENFVGSIMADDALGEIIRIANVETALRISQNIDPKHSIWLQR